MEPRKERSCNLRKPKTLHFRGVRGRTTLKYVAFRRRPAQQQSRAVLRVETLVSTQTLFAPVQRHEPPKALRNPRQPTRRCSLDADHYHVQHSPLQSYPNYPSLNPILHPPSKQAKPRINIRSANPPQARNAKRTPHPQPRSQKRPALPPAPAPAPTRKKATPHRFRASMALRGLLSNATKFMNFLPSSSHTRRPMRP